MRRPSLQYPATIADVIGWTIAVPVALFGLLTLPSMAQLPSKFQPLVREVGTPPAWQLKMVLALQDVGVAALMVGIALGPLVILLCASRATTKVLAPVCGAIAMVWFNWFVLGSLLEWA